MTSPSPFGALAVIVDPAAGEGRVRERIEEVGDAVRALDYDHRIDVASERTQVTGLASRALDQGYRFVAAVGDDVTVQHVVNGIFRNGRTIVEAPVLGLVPADTACDLARSFGLPGDVLGAVRHLQGDVTYPFDVMKVAATAPSGERVIRYAHNVVEVGFHAAATARARRLPRWLGNARRFIGFWGAYATTRTQRLELDTDAKTREIDAWSVVIGNGQFADEGIRLSPRSFPGDGVMDVLAFTGPRSDAYRLLPRMFRHGDHIPDPGIAEFRAKLTMAVRAPRPIEVVADGVPFGVSPVSVQMVPQQILLKV